MKLSPNFYLREFLWSEVAARAGRVVEAPDDVVANLKHLCVSTLQPIRNALTAHYKRDMPIDPSSGYRPLWLNKLVKGSKTSDHMLGLACDFGCPYLSDYELAVFIRDKMLDRLPIKQLILEFDSWVHVGVHLPGEVVKREVLTARTKLVNNKSKTVYLSGLVKKGD